MPGSILLNLAPYFISFAISSGVSAYAWRHRTVAGAGAFAIATAAQAAWIFGYLFELMSPSLPGKIAWDDFQFVGAFLLPVAAVMFALDFSGRPPRRRGWAWAGLALLPTLFMLLVITESRHGLIRGGTAQLRPGQPFDILDYDFTPAVWVSVIYIYGLLLFSLGLLARLAARRPRHYRGQIGVIFLGWLIPMAGSVLTLFGVSLGPQRDATPFTFAAANLIITWGLFRYQLFNIVPIARESVVESMRDAVIVLDARQRVVDANPAAQTLLGRATPLVFGQPAAVTLARWPRLSVLAEAREPAQEELALGEPGAERYFDLRVSPLALPAREPVGSVIVLRDITQRKRAEAALQQAQVELEQRVQERSAELTRVNAALQASQERLQMALAATRMGVWEWEIATNAVTWFGPVAALFGLRPDEFGGTFAAYLDLIDPHDTAALQRALAASLSGEQPAYRVEHRVRLPDSAPRWVEGKGQVERDAAGRPLRMVGTVADVTDRKRAEAELLRSESHWRAVFNGTMDAIFIHDDAGRVLAVNTAMLAMYAVPLDDALAHTIQDYSAADQPLHQLAEAWAAVLAGQPQLLEWRARRPGDQSVFPVEVALRRIDWYDQPALLAVVRDITERKQAEAAGRAQAVRAQVLSDLAQMFSEATNDFTRIAAGTVQRCAELIGDGASLFWYTPERPELDLVAVHNPDADLTAFFLQHLAAHPIRADEAAYGRVIAANQPLLIPVVNLEQLRASAPLERRGLYERMPIYSAVFAPLRAEGKCLGVLGLGRHHPGRPAYTAADLMFLQDIADRSAMALLNARLYQRLERELSERTLAEAEVRRLNAELEQRVTERTAELKSANAELEAFAYSVSHDLRAPLRSLDGFSHELLDGYADQLDDQGKDYLHRLRRASQRMSQLIDGMLRLARITRSELRRERVDLSALALDILGELQRANPERRAEVRVAAGLTAAGDENLLRNVLENLLGNAWKFTSRRPVAHIEFGLAGGAAPVYFVRDNGAGFDMAYSSRAFGVFQRLHTEAEFPGTGLGLAVVQRVIERHGGRVWVEAAVEHGATFYFTLAAP